VSHSEKILCFASGGVEIGFGHLYRLTNIIEIMGLKNKSIFLATNDIESQFLKKRKFKIIKQQTHNDFNFSYAFVDSKYDCMDMIDGFFKNKENTIIIDRVDRWAIHSGEVIVPSFFINKDKIKKSYISENSILWGKHYSVLKEPKLYKKELNDKILLTFGGSDPNDISSIVLNLLYDSNYMNRLKIIIGPGYKHKKDYLLSKYPEIDFVFNSEDMQTEIANASIIITSFGTILQEAEYYGKKVILAFNYDDDESDFKWLLKATRNPDNWISLRNYKFINRNNLFRAIESLDLILESEIDSDQHWGSSWKTLLN